jgi:hypothetical protein
MATKTKEAPKQSVQPPKDVKPPKPDTKAETRMFQGTSGKHAWLTKEEAESKGHYWKD